MMSAKGPQDPEYKARAAFARSAMEIAPAKTAAGIQRGISAAERATAAAAADGGSVNEISSLSSAIKAIPQYARKPDSEAKRQRQISDILSGTDTQSTARQAQRPIPVEPASHLTHRKVGAPPPLPEALAPPSEARTSGTTASGGPLPARVTSAADLGKLVRGARRRLKLSQQAFGDLAGVGRRFVSELEAGKATLEIGKTLACCAAAGIDLFAHPRVSG